MKNKQNLQAYVENASELVDEFVNVLNSSKIKKTFRLGSEMFDALQPFIEKPSYWTAGKALFSIGRVLVDSQELWPEEYFDLNVWVEPYSCDYNATIIHALAKYPFVSYKTAVEGTYIKIITIDDLKIGTIYNTKINHVENIYVEYSRLEEAKKTIKNILWEQFKNKPLVLKQNKVASNNANFQKIVLEVDDTFNFLPSAKATEYSSYLKKCFDANVPRSVMLYGPPGTGKSTLARALVDNLNLRSFRIRVEDISDLSNGTLFEAISIFEPQAIIFDDFDRSSSQSSLLETLEFFQRHVKLVVATVNDKNQLDEALLRPGRFDELVLVDKMDEAVVKHLLGEFVDGYEEVKDWPIAFIQEYAKRRKFMSSSEVKTSMEELAERVKRLESYVEKPEDIWDNILEKKAIHKNSKKRIR